MTAPWFDTTLQPRNRAEALVAAMTLEQKIAQLHGAMETIDIYALSAQIAEEGGDLDALAAQIQIERHVTGIDELGIPRFRITNGPVGVGMGDGTPSPPATSLPMTIGLAAGLTPSWPGRTATSSVRRRRHWANTYSRVQACVCIARRSPAGTSSTSRKIRICPECWAWRWPKPSRPTT